MKQNTKGNCLSPEAEYIIGKSNTSAAAEFFEWLTPSMASECIITLMRITTQSEEYGTYSEIEKCNLWHSVNIIRAVLFDLDSQDGTREL